MIKLKTVKYKNITLQPKTDFFPIKTFSKNGLLIATNKEINLYVYAKTMSQLKIEIQEQIAIMWLEFVLNPKEDLLTEDSLLLKNSLLESFTNA